MTRTLIFLAVLALGVSACGSGNENGNSGQAAAGASSQTPGASDKKGERKVALAPEPTPHVLSLPADYPETWFFADDIDFPNMVDGKVVILDAAATTREYKGQLPAGMAASFAQSFLRHELYVAETIHEYRVNGPRRDVLTIYDTSTLKPVGRVELPGKRYQGMPYRASMILIDDDRLALVYNFTPAASVTVVDLAARKVLSEIPIPGCAMMYSVGQRGFSTVCGNGGLTTIQLDESGDVVSQHKSPPFIDIDNNAMFLTNAEIGGIRYFPTYKGDIWPIDFRGVQPKILRKWALVNAGERDKGWAPGGWQLITADSAGEFYILMHPNSEEGTHKDPSTHVWVYSPKKKSRVREITLQTPAISIEATRGKEPYLVAFNINMQLDIYNALTGAYVRTIHDAAASPFGIYAVR